MMTFNKYINMILETTMQDSMQDIPDLRNPNDPRLVAPETEKILNTVPTNKIYRSMTIGKDGNLYPPMSGRVEGKLRKPEPIGVWMRSEENPHLVPDSGRNKGKFPLKKENPDSKTLVWALYNPYFHLTDGPLNDQFDAAWRSNNVLVEAEYPVSELKGNYTAPKASNSVGYTKWKNTPLYKKLGKQRKVVLSRWVKNIRILSDAETAQIIINYIGPDNINKISFKDTTLSPNLRKELEKLGVKIKKTGKITEL